eukprot:m.337792 g.337792  ORF g.337792 m.337792 type:complete len:316 (-) comp18235_c0_seq1:206-1153(-)
MASHPKFQMLSSLLFVLANVLGTCAESGSSSVAHVLNAKLHAEIPACPENIDEELLLNQILEASSTFTNLFTKSETFFLSTECELRNDKRVMKFDVTFRMPQESRGMSYERIGVSIEAFELPDVDEDLILELELTEMAKFQLRLDLNEDGLLLSDSFFCEEVASLIKQGDSNGIRVLFATELESCPESTTSPSTTVRTSTTLPIVVVPGFDKPRNKASTFPTQTSDQPFWGVELEDYQVYSLYAIVTLSAALFGYAVVTVLRKTLRKSEPTDKFSYEGFLIREVPERLPVLSKPNSSTRKTKTDLVKEPIYLLSL